MFRRLGLVLVALSFAVGYSSFFEHIAQADITSCSAQVYLHSTPQGSVPDFQFQITNNDSNPINWIVISTPSDSFVTVSANASGWNGSSNTQQTTFTNGTINPGDSFDQIDLSTIATTASPSADWTVQVSDDPGGADPFSCTGDLGTAIVPPAPAISNISVTALAPKSVIVNWDTDVDSTSQVNYGPDSSYGQSTSEDINPASSHSVKLTGLSPNTGYHFQVVSVTPDGGATGTSSDGTFLTAIQEPVAVTAQTNSAPIAIQITNPEDKTPPQISINSPSSKILRSAPTITGSASDDVLIQRIEYSTDGGKDWLPAGTATGLGGKAVSYSFTPQNLDDGNYVVLARAIDGGGNITTTKPFTIVIDRLPPIVGGNVISLGPQILKPDQNGTIKTLADVDEKISLSAVGGPSSVTLSAVSGKNHKTFALTRSPDNNLWSGLLSFSTPGTYKITADSIDGAGNKTSRLINNVNVLAPSKISKPGNAKLKSQVTAYYLDNQSNNWVVWDGSPYGQTNPQATDPSGKFNLILPAGKYYLKASSKGGNATSNIFNLSETTPVSTTLALKGSGRLPWLNFATQKVSLNTGSKTAKNPLIGQAAPNFNLTDTNGQASGPVSWLGKPTLITLGSTWSPAVTDQLKVINQLQANKNINVELVAVGQNNQQAQVYNQISSYSLDWLADPDNSLSESYGIGGLPTHYFINRQGVIKQVVSGVLSKQEILNDLSGL